MDATEWDRRYLDTPSPWTDNANAFLVAETSELSPGRALDLACGEGRNALWLARRGWQVTGLDFSSVAIERASARAAEEGLNADFETTDLREWRPEDRFDLVCVLYLHLVRDEIAPIMSRAAEAVADGGILFVIGHHTDNLDHGTGGPQSPEVLYTQDDLTAWCPLEIVRAERVSRQSASGDSAIDALLVARRAPSPVDRE